MEGEKSGEDIGDAKVNSLYKKVDRLGLMITGPKSLFKTMEGFFPSELRRWLYIFALMEPDGRVTHKNLGLEGRPK